LKGVPSITTEISIPEVANHVPHLYITYDRDKVKIAPREVMAELRKGTPSIELNPSSGRAVGAGAPASASTLVVGVWMLQPGEEMIVARRLREVLEKAPRA
jgi:L-seryl-tRNA(Ser) seleniumtransferase